MPSSKKPARKRSSTKSPKKSEPNQISANEAARAEFHRGMLAWLKGNGYQVGITGQDLKSGKELDWAEALIKHGKELVGTAMPMHVASGADAETVFNTMFPVLPLGDLIGFKIKIGTPILIVVIYADDLGHPDVLDRFTKLFELSEPLAHLGLRLNGRGQGAVFVCPLVVYSNPDKFAADVPVLKPLGYRKKFMHQAIVDPVYINLPAQELIFRELSGFMTGLVQKLNTLLGLKYPIFDKTDLDRVFFLAKQPQ